jgi:recombination protein RecR
MNDLEQLIALLAKLPGLGPRSARRAALHILKKRDSLLYPLLQSLQATAETIQACGVCGNWDVRNPCHICADARRDTAQICVVEEVADLWAIERSRAYAGLYHVLGGSLSALDGISPENLSIDDLVRRAANQNTREIILATNATVQGQTTAHYLTDRLQGLPLKISRLAYGLPMGGELDYLDEGTLTTALAARLPF